jgi:hypothetical protein
LTVVNFETLERRKPIIGLNDLFGDALHRPAVARVLPHVFGRSQWLAHSVKHAALNVVEIYHATTFSAT